MEIEIKRSDGKQVWQSTSEAERGGCEKDVVTMMLEESDDVLALVDYCSKCVHFSLSDINTVNGCEFIPAAVLW